MAYGIKDQTNLHHMLEILYLCVCLFVVGATAPPPPPNSVGQGLLLIHEVSR